MIARFLKWILSFFEQKQPSRIRPTIHVSKVPWLAIALDELYQLELPGIEHNPRIIEYHSVTKLSAMEDETAWCSAFVCWCLEEAGIASPRSAWAKSFLGWGQKVYEPYQGCIVVFHRGSKNQSGHVGFYFGEDQKGIKVLGGNQENQVCIKTYSRSKLIGYREPKQKEL